MAGGIWNKVFPPIRLTVNSLYSHFMKPNDKASSSLIPPGPKLNSTGLPDKLPMEAGIMIPNLVGTARGLHYTKEHASFFKFVKSVFNGTETNFYALPGVPKEMKSMFSNYVLPEIEKTNKNKVVCRSIRTTGVPESILQEKISDIIDKNKDKCDIAFLPHRMLGVDIRLTTSDQPLINILIDSILE